MGAENLVRMNLSSLCVWQMTEFMMQESKGEPAPRGQSYLILAKGTVNPFGNKE